MISFYLYFLLTNNFFKLWRYQRGNQKSYYLTALNLEISIIFFFLYKLFIDDLLNLLEKSNCGIRLRDINCDNPAFADDIALLALSPKSLQTLVNICFTYSRIGNSNLAAQKLTFLSSFVEELWVIIRLSRNLEMNLCKQPNSKIHLGIPILSEMNNTEAVIKACDKSKKSLHGLLGICNFQREFHPNTHIK